MLGLYCVEKGVDFRKIRVCLHRVVYGRVSRVGNPCRVARGGVQRSGTGVGVGWWSLPASGPASVGWAFGAMA